MTTRDPAAGIARRHVDRMDPRGLCHVRAAAIIRGDDPDAAAPIAGAAPASAAAWAAFTRAMDRAHVVAVHHADSLPLADACARLAALSDARSPDVPDPERASLTLARETRAALEARRHDAAAFVAGIRAWCEDAAGVDALDVLDALAGDAGADARAWWHDGRRTLEDAAAAVQLAPDTVAGEAERWRMMAAAG